MKQITVLGWYQHENTGDDSYELAFPKVFPGYDFVFTDKLPKGDTDVILGGGDVLHPYFLNQLEKQPHRSVHAISVNVFDSKKIDELPPQFKTIYIRNKLEDIKLRSGLTVGCIPDLAFILEPDPIAGLKKVKQLFKEAEADLYNKLVLVVINAHLFVGEAKLARDQATFDKFCHDLASIMDNTAASFLFIPFGNGFPHNDRITNAFVYGRCKYWKKNCLVFEHLSVQDTLNICSTADAMISSRLHSSIFSTMGGTPFIDVSHHSKNQVFLDFIGHAEWGVNYWRLDATRLQVQLNTFLNDPAAEQELLRITASCRQQLQNLSVQMF